MAIYTKSGGEIKSVTPFLKRNGEVIIPSSVWVKHGGEVHKVWPVEEPVPEGPFEIYDKATLQEFIDRVDAGEYDLDAVVTDDINLVGNSHIAAFASDNSARYTGTFDGQNHTITKNYGTTLQGLCSNNAGTIKNITLSGTTGCGGSVEKGGIVGSNYGGTVANCTVINGEVDVSWPTGRAGGIVGYNSGTVTDCTFTGTVVTPDDGGTSGGIVGRNTVSGVVERCTNEGDVSGYYAGGIVGYNYGGTVADCTNTGTVTGTVITELSATTESTSAAGGIVGYNTIGSTVEGNTNEGEVTGAAHTGDIIGMEGPAKEEDVPEEAASTEEE